MLTPRLRKTIDWVLGLMLIGIGVVGGFIPILQGWVFILAGLAVLSSHSRIARQLHDRIRALAHRVKERVIHHREDPPGS